jgi:LPXTG-motif cell wall-anchored protein
MLIMGIGAVCGATLLLVSLQMRSRRTLRSGRLRPVLAGSTALFAAAMLVVVMVAGGQPAAAIAVVVPLGTAEPFAVLGGQSVTNTGPTVLWGDVGVAPGTSIIGFPPGIFLGTEHQTDAVAFDAQDDLTTAYDNAAGQTDAVTLLPPDAGLLTLTGGIYNASSSLGLTGTLTLDAQGDPNTVWIFQVGSTLITAPSSLVSLVNGAQPCNVFWQIGSSATLGTASTFVGTVLALTSITATTGATIDGRLLARNGSVTLDTNIITNSACLVVPPPTTSTIAATTPSTVDTGGSTTIDAGGTTTPGGGGTTTPGAVPTTVGTPITPPGGGNLTIPPTLVTLPATGSETGGTAIAATILVALGIGVLAVARRRVQHH